MKELEVTFTIRNNRLKERRLQLGLSQRALAHLIGIATMTYANYERMHPSAKLFYTRTRGDHTVGEWVGSIQKIAQFYNEDPAVLFPPTVTAVEMNKSIRKIDAQEIPVLLSGACDKILPAETQQLNPEEIVAFRESIDRYQRLLLPKLTKAEQLVVKLRYDKELTYAEIAKGINRTASRVQQIQQQVMRKIRKLNHDEKINKDLTQDEN